MGVAVGTLTGNVTALAATVAFLAGRESSTAVVVAALVSALGAVAGLEIKSVSKSILMSYTLSKQTYDVALLVALVASLGLGLTGTVTGDMTLQTACAEKSMAINDYHIALTRRKLTVVAKTSNSQNIGSVSRS